MKKHGAVLDMQNNQLSFWPGHYQHDVALKPRAAEPQARHREEEAPHAEDVTDLIWKIRSRTNY